MPKVLPLNTRNESPHFSVGTVINDQSYTFSCKWNSRDNSWYLDVDEESGTPIVSGVRIVLGVYLGRKSTHPLFTSGVFVAIDLSRQSKEATIDDLGTRVIVVRYSVEEIVAGRGVTP